MVLRDGDKDAAGVSELLYIKIQDKLYCFDLSYRKKVSVGSLYNDFDPSFFHILKDGRTFIGLKRSKLDVIESSEAKDVNCLVIGDLEDQDGTFEIIEFEYAIKKVILDDSEGEAFILYDSMPFISRLSLLNLKKTRDAEGSLTDL